MANKKYGWFIKDNVSEIAKEWGYPDIDAAKLGGERCEKNPQPIRVLVGGDYVWVDPDMLERREIKREVTDADIGAWFKAASEFCGRKVSGGSCIGCPASAGMGCTRSSAALFNDDIVREWLEETDAS